MRELAQAVGGAKARAHSEVVHRQHVLATELEDEQHLYRPPADAAHFGQLRDDRLVVEPLERCAVRHLAAQGLGGEVLERGDLGEREAGGAQLPFGRRQHLLRRGEGARAAGGDEAPEDGVGGGAVQLLVSDRLSERLEGLAAAVGLETAGTRGAHHAGEHRVGLGEMAHDVRGLQSAHF